MVQADDWILYSMTHQAELARVRCGGWRRQYTHIITSPSEFTFACYRNRKIHIDRRLTHSSPAAPGEHPNHFLRLLLQLSRTQDLGTYIHEHDVHVLSLAEPTMGMVW